VPSLNPLAPTSWGGGLGAWGVGRGVLGAWGVADVERGEPRFPGCGTELNFGVTFEHEDGSAIARCTSWGEINACKSAARHAAKCAESIRIRSVAWRSLGADGPARRSGSVSLAR